MCFNIGGGDSKTCIGELKSYENIIMPMLMYICVCQLI